MLLVFGVEVVYVLSFCFHSTYRITKVQIMTGFGWSLIKKELGGSEGAGTFITC